MSDVRGIRVYDPITEPQEQRVLVDRLWPRGLRKDDPRVGMWLPGVAPSAELRTWYGHRTDRRSVFADRYRLELDAADRDEPLTRLRELIGQGPVALTTATRAVADSHLPILIGHLSAA